MPLFDTQLSNQLAFNDDATPKFDVLATEPVIPYPLKSNQYQHPPPVYYKYESINYCNQRLRDGIRAEKYHYSKQE